MVRLEPRYLTSTSIISPFRQLGFDDASVNDFVAIALASTNAINLSYILRAFIKSNICLNAQDGILEELFQRWFISIT
jgi:hypothetical protein